MCFSVPLYRQVLSASRILDMCFSVPLYRQVLSASRILDMCFSVPMEEGMRRLGILGARSTYT